RRRRRRRRRTRVAGVDWGGRRRRRRRRRRRKERLSPLAPALLGRFRFPPRSGARCPRWLPLPLPA
ncbi:unnamed protein product, partial [Coccothraustes coccothraustes]